MNKILKFKGSVETTVGRLVESVAPPIINKTGMRRVQHKSTMVQHPPYLKLSSSSDFLEL